MVSDAFIVDLEAGEGGPSEMDADTETSAADRNDADGHDNENVHNNVDELRRQFSILQNEYTEGDTILEHVIEQINEIKRQAGTVAAAEILRNEADEFLKCSIAVFLESGNKRSDDISHKGIKTNLRWLLLGCGIFIVGVSMIFSP